MEIAVNKCPRVELTGVGIGLTPWYYTNRGTKAVLMKNGSVHRELNRSFYCADVYDYPIAIGVDGADRVVVVHCPKEFDLLEIDDAETGTALDSLKS